MQRRSPVRFEDIDKLLAMLVVIYSRVGPLEDFSDARGLSEKYRFNAAETPEFKSERVESWIEEVARGSVKGQALQLWGSAHSTPDARWSVDLSSDVAAVSAWGRHAEPTANILGRLAEAVELHTTPMRRSSTAVIEPVHAPDAARRKHDDELATRINRAGMLWGGLAGVLGGGAIQGIAALMR
jgi:hypothetical protein